jgi:hypothetical protein
VSRARGGQQSSGDGGLCSRERRTQGAVWHGERTEWTCTTPWDMSSRFIESRGREKVGQGERMVGVFNGHRCVSYRRITREEETEALMILNVAGEQTRGSVHDRGLVGVGSGAGLGRCGLACLRCRGAWAGRLGCGEAPRRDWVGAHSLAREWARS